MFGWAVCSLFNVRHRINWALCTSAPYLETERRLLAWRRGADQAGLAIPDVGMTRR
jgi:hypothetical protein